MATPQIPTYPVKVDGERLLVWGPVDLPGHRTAAGPVNSDQMGWLMVDGDESRGVLITASVVPFADPADEYFMFLATPNPVASELLSIVDMDAEDWRPGVIDLGVEPIEMTRDRLPSDVPGPEGDLQIMIGCALGLGAAVLRIMNGRLPTVTRL